MSRWPAPTLALWTMLLASAARGETPASSPTSMPARTPSVWPSCKTRPLPAARPEEVGLDAGVTADLQALLADAVATKVTPAAALVAVRRGRVFFRGFAGAARPDSIWDVASLTKVVATTPSVMHLVERRRLALATRVSRHLDLFGRADKRPITLLHLLTHASGLPSVVWAGPLTDRRPEIAQRIARAKLLSTPGASYRYSDIGYVSLGELVAAVSGKPLDAYARTHLYEPLGMCDTGFSPPPRAMPRLLSPWPRGENPGVVYDPIAARLGGVAGHAGIFSTADDLARCGQMMLAGGALGGKRVLAARTVASMTQPRALAGEESGRRGLGWDVSSPHAGCCRARLSPRAFGHIGFTGTSLWIDPELQLVVVLLANRTFYEPGPSVTPLRRRVHDLIATAAVRGRRGAATGLDRLVENGCAELRGRRVGLITNRTAVSRDGRWIGDLLAAPGDQGTAPEVVALFVPEHGLGARVDRRIGDSTVRLGERRVPVYSLFGERRRPSPRTLAGIDTLVFDLQTVGVRYYTYLATMGWAMEEAAKRKLRFVVLDRPNPIGGVVQGPVASAERRTSTSYHPIPVRYGMTVGELARLYNAERRIGARLQVIKLRGWRRAQLFPETGQVWVDPSPNIRSWRAALLYAGVGMLESTNVSVGRGTDSPFALVGAPWIDGPALAAAMTRRALPGLHFVATSFTPTASPHRGQRCNGARVVLTDPTVVDPPAAGIALAVTLRRLYPQQWETKHLYRLINHLPTTEAILAGKELKQILPLWTAGLEQFRRVRARYLLY
jgi:uncharacterized protein YbbC (DUF1343 family)